MMIVAKAKSLFAMLREKAGPDYVVGFPESADVKAAEDFLDLLGTLMVEEIYCQGKYSIWMKSPYSENGCLKGLSSIRRPSQCQLQGL